MSTPGPSPGGPATARRPLHVHALIDHIGFGGAEAALADFAEGVAGGDVRLTVGYLSDVGDYALHRIRATGVQPEYVPTRSLFRRRDRDLVREHLRRVAPDLVHTHLDYADVLGGLAARSLGLPSVSTWHLAEVQPGMRATAVSAISSRVRARAASRVITVSEAARREYLGRWGPDPDRVVTIHNGVGRAVAPGEGPAVRRELGIPQDALVLTTVGLLRPEKGQAVAAAAMREIRAAFPTACLLVVGDGVERPAIEAIADELGHDVVRLAGQRSDVMRLLDATDLVLQPSRSEALGMSIIEAMAAGVPTVATDVGGIPELVDDATGALVPAPPEPAAFAAAVIRLLGDPEGRARRGAAARERYLDGFTVERWVARTRALYDDVLAAAPERGRR